MTNEMALKGVLTKLILQGDIVYKKDFAKRLGVTRQGFNYILEKEFGTYDWDTILAKFGVTRTSRKRQTKKSTGGKRTVVKPSVKYTLPTYKQYMDWCRENPDKPFAERMTYNCETSSRKHWRSIVMETLDILRMMEE